MNIYFAGSIRGGRDDAELYKQMIDFLNEHGTVLTEHLGSTELGDQGEDVSDEDIYDRDIRLIDKADLIVAEVSTPSLGVGYEIGYAESKGKRIVLLHRNTAERTLSAMIGGNEAHPLIRYDGLDDLKPSLIPHFGN
ncbi:MAG: nucleoside 2-deoxyribosyltransferase [Candidatus Paceibacterota bacterium]